MPDKYSNLKVVKKIAEGIFLQLFVQLTFLEIII